MGGNLCNLAHQRAFLLGGCNRKLGLNGDRPGKEKRSPREISVGLAFLDLNSKLDTEDQQKLCILFAVLRICVAISEVEHW